MRAEINDAMMFVHAIGLIMLAFLIYRAAYRNEPGFWRRYPPELFFLWGTQVLVDGAIYGRRLLSRHGYEFADYGGWFSVVLNVAAVVLLVALIYRISRGVEPPEKEGTPTP